MRKLTLLALPLALAGCQSWGPTWSEVSGDRYFRTEINTSATIINTIDGTSPVSGNPTRVAPGQHKLALTAVPLSPNWKSGTDLAYFDLVAEPCKRYYVAARFENPLGPRFTPYLDYVEPIAGCTLAAVK